jgi:calcium-binding protein CML
MASFGERLSDADIREMIGDVDADGDGLINFQEFKKMMGK